MKLRQHRFRVITALLVFLLAALCAMLVIRSLRPVAVLSPAGETEALQALRETVTPGRITDRTGAVLASTEDGVRIYAEPAERRASLVHLLGESSGLIPGGVETLHAADLYGARPALAEAISRLIKKQDRTGYDLTLTVSGDLCEQILRSAAAHPETAGKPCCAVVIRYDTGEIGAMASLPTFDPQHLTDEQAKALREAADQPLKNRVTEGIYPLGPLKAVFPEPLRLPLSSTALYRDLIAEEPDYPLATPLKLCLMTCAAATDGQMPEPRLIRTVKTAAGALVTDWSQAILGRYCTEEQAAVIRAAMKESAAEEGAQTLVDPVLNLHAAFCFAEDSIAAEHPHRYAWCTAFNAQQDLPWAVTVLVEDPAPEETVNGAALIARDLFAWLKAHPQLTENAD